MGEVHRAEDLEAGPDSPHRRVAVKTVLRGRTGIAVDTSGSGKEVDRFRREVRIMRMLSQGHPNLTLLIDGGVDDAPGGSGLPYPAMELLDGNPLADLIDEEPQLPVSWAAAIGAQIAAGLTAGVVHRDLKPANVMLTGDGTVKILDFGMGSIVDDPDQTRLTGTGVSLGTARHMAPEQFRAERVPAPADLYALGCILYELLVGRPPFSARTHFELSEQHLRERPPQLTLACPDLPAGLVRLVERLLEKDAELRPENAALVREVLLPLALAPDATAGLLAPHWRVMDPVARLRALLPERTPAAPAPVPRREPRLPEAMDVFGIHADLIAEYESFTLTQNLASPAEVDKAVQRARAAGATVLKEPQRAAFGGYHGYFADPDGHRWEVCHNPGWSVADDGTVTLAAVDAPGGEDRRRFGTLTGKVPAHRA
ncbi:protein kinase [Streptomyces sp. NPDC057236]|uniref:protein kinase domain-containing protein n=1 Tax=Streptomyces sp. NPDC057236 TaxID=3346059 RepID=UPI00362E9EA8